MFRHGRSRHVSPPPNDGQTAPALLSELAAGQAGIVLGLQGGRGFVNRVASLGFTPGARVSVIENRGRGPLVVAIFGSHLALGRREADLIQVRPE